MSALLNVNGSLYEALGLQLRDTYIFVAEFVDLCVSRLPRVTVPDVLSDITEGGVYEQISEALNFSEIEWLLLKTFLIIFLLTCLLIHLSWKVYGKRISERFMIPATSATILQLKESVSKLKLPKEHTPRI